MTSLTRVRRLERVLADWFETNAPWMEIDGASAQMTTEVNVHYFDGVVTSETFSIHALAEELDQALDGILHEEAAETARLKALDREADDWAARR